jgi:hypothetical protein
MSDDVNVLVPIERSVKIGNEMLTVKPFSIRDVVYFTREIVEGLNAVKVKYPAMDFKKEDVLHYAPLVLDEVPRLFNLLARAIGKDGEWLQNQTDLVGVSNLFAVITEINDFGTILSNFRNGWSNLAKQTIRASAAQ